MLIQKNVNSPLLGKKLNKAYAWIDLLIIVTIIFMLTIVIYGGWQRASIVEDVNNIRADLRKIEKAINQLNNEKKLPKGTIVTFEQYKKYINKSSRLYKNNGRVRKNNFAKTIRNYKYPNQKIGIKPIIPSKISKAYENSIPKYYWSPYKIEYN